MPTKKPTPPPVLVPEATMPTLFSMLANHDPAFLLLDRNARLEVSGAVLLYAFRAIRSAELSSVFKKYLDWTGAQCLAFRKVSNGSGYIQKNLKFWVYAALVHKARPKTTEKPARSSFEVQRVDSKWLRVLIESNLYASKMLLRFVKESRQEYAPRSIKDFDADLISIYPDLLLVCRKFVTRKFRFLTKSGQLEAEAIVSSMTESSIRAIYRAYPSVDSPLHMKNIGIRTIHNTGINIIAEQTTKSRQRMIRNADGTFSGLVLSLSQGLRPNDTTLVGQAVSGICTPLIVGLAGVSVEGEQVTDVNRLYDLRHTLDQVQERMDTRSRRFVDLLMGEFDEAFSAHLGQANDEVAQKVGRLEYANLVRGYLRVSVETAKGIIHTLRTELRDFRN